MIFSKKLQTFLSLIPFFAISVGLNIFFFQKNIGLYTLYPTALCGAWPFIVTVSNKCGFVPKNSPNNWIRFLVSTWTWIVMTISFIMIGYIYRLTYAYSFAAPAIEIFSYSIIFALIAIFASNQQKISEIFSRPLFSNIITDDDFENEEEIDTYFAAIESDISFKQMKKEVKQNRQITMSQSFYCLFFATLMMVIGFAMFFPSSAPFDIFEPKTFSVSCINQQTLDAKHNATGMFIFHSSNTNCHYPFCSLRNFSSQPSIPNQFELDTEYGYIWLKRQQNTTLNLECTEYTILQTCDDLGYVGIVGKIQIGQNCYCSPNAAYNSDCNKNKKAPIGYDWNRLWYLAICVSIWTALIKERNNFMLWKLLRLYCSTNNQMHTNRIQQLIGADEGSEMTSIVNT